jgi:membrane protein implicated in regulation of membrane protease activity
MKLILFSLTLMLTVAGLAVSAGVLIHRGDDLAGSVALFLAGLVVLLMSLSQVFARKESPDNRGNRQPESGSQAA